MKKAKPFDFGLFITALILLGLGLITVLTASSHLAKTSSLYGHNAYYFFIRQTLWGVLGLIAMFFFSSYDYRKLKKWSGIAFFAAILTLVAVLIPGVGGGEIRGAKRWINLGFMNFQPSEFAKFAIILFLAASLDKNYKQLKYFWKGFVPYLIVVGIIGVLLILEPHYSSLVIVFVISMIILFVAGAPIKHFIMTAIPVIPLGAVLIAVKQYRADRIFGFLDPWADPSGTGWQAIQSLYALGSGGIFGLGLGQSRQKYLYLPDAHNDFIFSILGEELGFIGATLVILVFITFIWRGLRIAMKAPDLFGSLMATGLTSLVAVQVILNIAIVTSTMPVTGMPLPFFSYGGTALLFFMAYTGILLNISRHLEK